MSDRGPAAIASGIVFILLPIAAVSLRFYARNIRGTFGWDDWFIVPALLCITGSGIALLCGAALTRLGQHHISTVVPSSTPGGPPTNDPLTIEFEKVKYIISILSTLTIGFTKLSVLLLYWRLFSVEKWFRYLLSVMLVIVLIWTLGFSFSLVFQCNPISASWITPQFLLTPHCFEFLKFYNALPITDIITDILVLTTPIPMVLRLQLPTRQKLAVGGMFLLGALVCAAGIARLVVFQKSLSIIGSMDETYNAAETIIWSFIEGSLAVVSACLPTLRPLFQKSESKVNVSYTYGDRGGSAPGYSLKTLTRSHGGHCMLDDEHTHTID